MAPPNPDPSRITAELWRFVRALQELEPTDTGDLYPYADKPGYHNTRRRLIERGLTNDYSIRSADDKAGPDWACGAFDWISKSAQRGDRRIINRYGQRVRAAYQARDPRLHGWREVLTQVDAGVPEGYDLVGWYTRTPDGTHDWHTHFSKLRRYLAHWPSYAGMLSILAGEPLTVWLTGRSRYSPGGKSIMWMGKVRSDPSIWVPVGQYRSHIGAAAFVILQAAGWPIVEFASAADLAQVMGPDLATAPAIGAELAALRAQVAALETRPAGTLTLTPEDRVELVAGLVMQVGPIAQQAAEAAVRAVLGSLDGASPPAAG